MKNKLVTCVFIILPAGCLLEKKQTAIHLDIGAKACKDCHEWVMPFSRESGHGFTGIYKQTQHGKNGPGYDCKVCHNPHAPGHLDNIAGDKILRINNQNSELCLDCHRVGQTENGTLGYKAFSQASIHAAGVTGRYGDLPDYRYQCVDCHDPHGSSQLAMIKDTIDGGLGAGPYAVLFQDSLDFNPDWAEGDSIHEAEGVCDVCHLPGKPAHSRTEEGRNHESGSACWKCHFHTVSFDTITTRYVGLSVTPSSWKLSVLESWNLKSKAKSNLDVFRDVSAEALWTSLAPEIVSVDDTGLVTGISAGTGKVYADWREFSDTAEIQVNP